MIKPLAANTFAALLFAFAGLLATIGPAAAEKRVALVIGNSAYENVPKLQNPSNDATDMAAKLRSLNFDVVEGTDLVKRDMEKQIRAFGEKLEGADVGLFYYAGHGLQVDNKNYLAPIDAQLKSENDLDFEAIELDLVLKQMLRSAQTSIVFLDACRDNPLAQNLKVASRSVAVGRGLARVDAPASMMVVYSTEPGNVALDGTGRNSPFAEALLRHIDAEGESIGDMLIDVRNDVLQATDKKQRPFESASLTGQFYFKPGTPPAAAAATNSTDEIAALRKEIERLQTDQGAQLKSQQEQLALLQQKLQAETGSPAPDATNRVIAVEPGSGKPAEPAASTAAAPAAPSPNSAPGPSAPEPTKIAAAEDKAKPQAPEESKSAAPLPEGVTREQLASDIVGALKDLNCYQGRVSGKWDGQSQDALDRFNQLAKLDLNVDNPEPATLDALKAWKGPHCTVVAAPRSKSRVKQAPAAAREEPAPPRKKSKAQAPSRERAASSREGPPPPPRSHGSGDEQRELQRLFPQTNWPGAH